MHPLATLIVLNLSSVICVLAAVYLAVNESDAWGWFLLAAVVMVETSESGMFRVKVSSKKDSKSDT